jgi:hypothetical protein
MVFPFFLRAFSISVLFNLKGNTVRCKQKQTKINKQTNPPNINKHSNRERNKLKIYCFICLFNKKKNQQTIVAIKC